MTKLGPLRQRTEFNERMERGELAEVPWFILPFYGTRQLPCYDPPITIVFWSIVMAAIWLLSLLVVEWALSWLVGSIIAAIVWALLVFMFYAKMDR